MIRLGFPNPDSNYPKNATSGTVDYTVKAEIYQVQGLKAPPDPFLTVTKQYNATSPTATGAGAIPLQSDYMSIPQGYQATSATIVGSISAVPATTQNWPAYKAGTTYAKGANVSYLDVGYKSIVDGNKGNQPDISSAQWSNSWEFNLSVNIGTQFAQWGNGVWAGTFPNALSSDTGNIGSGWSIKLPLLSERGQIGLTVSGGVLLTYVVNIEVQCTLTPEAFAQWQLDTFTAINQAYLALLSTYQEATGQNQQALAGTNYPGSSPSENLRVIQTELKRELISLISQQQFDPPTVAPAYSPSTTYAIGVIVNYQGVAYVSLTNGNAGNSPDSSPLAWSNAVQGFDSPAGGEPYSAAGTYLAGNIVSYTPTSAIAPVPYVSLRDGNTNNTPDSSPAWWAPDTMTYIDPSLPAWSGNGAPSTRSALNFQNIQQTAPVIRFMEEGFEWEQMQYIFYPYYWNQKDQWFDLALIEDPDYLFNLFLRAGAARVVVPVRPHFEEVFVYYLQSGQVWNGTSPPQVYDATYLSIAQEIAAQDQQPVSETLVGEMWTMTLPTTLTMLRTPPQSASAYSAATTYSLGAVVSYNQETYSSLQSSNVGNEPITSPTWWTLTDVTLPSWALDDNLNILASN